MIPSNDDAIRAIKLLVAKVADAVIEGKGMRKDVDMAQEEAALAAAAAAPVAPVPARKLVRTVDADEENDDAALLGKSTLAKLARSADLDTPAEEIPA